MSDLPNGWASAKIPDVLAELPTGNIIDQGWSPKCESFPSNNTDKWGALKTTAIQDGRFEQQHTKQLPNHLEPKPALEVKAGDLLMTCAGPRVRCGVICRVKQVRPKLFISGKMYRFRPNEEIIDGDYLLGVLRSPELRLVVDQIKTGGNESGLNLTQDRFTGLDIPLPPLPEQRRIVTKLDNLFERTTAARDELDRIPLLIEHYKQALIDEVFSQIIDRLPLQKHVDADRGIPYGIIQTGNPFPAGIPTIRCGDIKGFRVDRNELKLVDPNIEAAYQRTRLQGGEVLIAIRGTVGATVVVSDELRGCNISREVAMIPVTEAFFPEFIMYFLSSSEARRFIFGNVKGVAQQGINLRDLKNVPTPVCSISMQHECVRRIETAFAWIDGLASEARQASVLLDHLDKGLLSKAFRGQLVPQDPNDEPAEKQLKRIRAKRAASPRSQGRGRRRRSMEASGQFKAAEM